MRNAVEIQPLSSTLKVFSPSFKGVILYGPENAYLDCCSGAYASGHILIPGTNPDAKNMEQKIIKDPASILPEMTSALLHDAVLNTAIVWKYIWKEATN
jgi:hypothetical protein